MAIYLDTNVMINWRTFAELDRLALAILADQIHQQMVIPSVVAEELEGRYRRELHDAMDTFEAASSDVTELFGLDFVHTEPALWPEGVLDQWRIALHEAFEVCAVEGVDALAGLSREVLGLPPAKPRQPKKRGAGGRDAAIWLSVVRDHRGREEIGHFITRDTTDFMSRGALKRTLANDLEGCEYPLNVYASVEDLLVELGEHSDVHVDVEEVRRLALPLIKEGVRDSRLLPRVVFTDDHDRLRFRTEVVDGTVAGVRRARRFAGPLGKITLIDAEWELDVRILYGENDSDPTHWFAIDDLHLAGPLQVYVGGAQRDDDPRDPGGQFIGAQMSSNKTVFFSGDRVLSIGR